jgi:uncharacterized protein (DUF849 family)
VLVEACLNGSRSREAHRAIPLSPVEIARDASQAVRAGAAALHIHPRAADGSESLDPGVCDAVARAVHAACPGVPVGFTTGIWIEPDPKRRLSLIASWAVAPDFVSVNLSEPGIPELCDLLLRRGIAIEAGVWSVADAQALAALGVASQCLRVLVEAQPGEPQAAAAEARAIDDALDAAGIRIPRLHHGEGFATWAVIEGALDRGRDIRVGLEDTLHLPDGTPARDNAELVEAAVAMVRRRRAAPSKN